MGLAMRYVKEKNEAVEMVNSAFIKILKALPTYDSKKEFNPWIKRIVVNTCLDHLRNKKVISQNAVLLDDHEGFKESVVDDEVWDWIDQEYLDFIVSKLSTIERSVFLMFALDGFTHSEIAEAHSFSERTSKRVLKEARETLKKQIISDEKVVRKA